MSKSPYIYVFLKDESGTPISLIPLLSQTPLKQNFKTISDKIKLPKNKLIELRVQGSSLNETKSLQDQNVKPYSDIQIIIKDEFSIKEIKEPHYSKPTPLNAGIIKN